MTATATLESPAMPAEVLAAVREDRRVADEAEARLLARAVQWAVMHPVESLDDRACFAERGYETDLTVAGVGAPVVAEFCVAEFAAAVGMSTEAGKRYLGEALELRYRLPRLWRRVVKTGDLPAWKARKVARETFGLSMEAAGFVDRHLAPSAHRVGPVVLERLVEESVARFMPERAAEIAQAATERRHVTFHDQGQVFAGTMEVTAELDLADALDLNAAITAGAEQRKQLGSEDSLDVRRSQALGDLARRQPVLDFDTPFDAVDTQPDVPRVPARQVVLYVHLTDAALAGHDPVARLERGNTLITVDQARAWCGDPDTSKITLKPVLDLAACDEIDSDVVPARHTEQITVRDGTCVFPWCTHPARPSPDGGHGCDADHIHPRSRGGPTCPCNLAPLCRRHHRLKTHSPWIYESLDPGRYVWTSPHRHRYLRDTTGTHPTEG